MKNLVVLTGAGISSESGLLTFRGVGGLWGGYDVMQVASIDGWRKDPELVLDFYNKRRIDAFNAQPNAAHCFLAELEKSFNVQIITQNVDDLHERAGSSNILHLHGELNKARSSKNPNDIISIGKKEIKIGVKAKDGSQLRPHIVWFGEDVPLMIKALEAVQTADILIIIGTSLQVYPAASLIEFCPSSSPICVIDPNAKELNIPDGVHLIPKNASESLAQLRQWLE